MGDVLTLSQPSTPTQTTLIPYHPDSLSARLSTPRSSTSGFFHWPPPVYEPESPTPNMRKQGASPSSGRLFIRESPSPPKPRPSKLTRQESPAPEDLEEDIHDIFENYKANSEENLYLCRDELIHLIRRAKSVKSGPGGSTLLKDLVKRCNILRFEGFANSDVVHSEMSPNVLNYMSAFLGQLPIRREPPLVWVPPDFDKADDYCYQACTHNTHMVDFGCFRDETIKASMCGFVECWGESHFTGDGIMTLEIGSGKKMKRVDINVVVLGEVGCTGTAILLDSSGRLWFYNVPMGVGSYLEGTAGQATLIAFPSTGVSKYTEIRLTKRFVKVDMDVKENKYGWDE
jgi:hypothetical protein